MTLVGSLVAGLAATWKHVPDADSVRSSKSRKKVLPNQLGRYYDKPFQQPCRSRPLQNATATSQSQSKCPTKRIQRQNLHEGSW